MLAVHVPGVMFMRYFMSFAEANWKYDAGPCNCQDLADALAHNGVATAAASYRLHPAARWPDYLDDAAAAVVAVAAASPASAPAPARSRGKTAAP